MKPAGLIRFVVDQADCISLKDNLVEPRRFNPGAPGKGGGGAHKPAIASVMFNRDGECAVQMPVSTRLQWRASSVAVSGPRRVRPRPDSSGVISG